MASIAHKLTVDEFERQYGCEKPYYEYWHGEAIQKSMPTSLHGLLQSILMALLWQAGFKAASEVKLKIDPEFQLIPDVIASHDRFELPYPTRSVEIVVEILSHDDPMSRVLTKCRMYQSWGFEQIYVLDPEDRRVFRWTEHRLEEVGEFASIPVDRIWAALDAALQ